MLYLIPFAALFVSCELFAGKEVVLRLPDLPEFVSEASEGALPGVVPDLSPWTVSWLDENGMVRSIVTGSGGRENIIAVRPGKIPWLIAVACPAGDFRPAGICTALSGNEFRFSWEDGAAARFFLEDGCKLYFLFLLLKVNEFNLDEFMALKSFAGRFDQGISQPFLPDKHNRFECVGQAS